MTAQTVEVLDESVNAWIVRTPGRRFPGIVIQGDRLSSWAKLAAQFAVAIPNTSETGETAHELSEVLTEALQHYESVLGRHGIAKPY